MRDRILLGTLLLVGLGFSACDFTLPEIPSTAPTLAMTQSAFQDYLNNLTGGEFAQAPKTADVTNASTTTQYTYESPGLVACDPGVPFPVANPTPTKPSTIYGCTQQVTLVWDTSVPDKITLSVDAAYVYMGWKVTSPSMAAGTYATIDTSASGVSLISTYPLLDAGNGLKQFGAGYNLSEPITSVAQIETNDLSIADLYNKSLQGGVNFDADFAKAANKVNKAIAANLAQMAPFQP